MDITTEALETQIEKWTNEKHQTIAKLNYLEGAIQSYRVLIAQIENGADAEIPAPDGKHKDDDDDSTMDTQEKT